MTLQEIVDLPDNQRKKVVFKTASGTVVRVMSMGIPIGEPDGPLDELQRQVDSDMRGGDAKARALFAEHGRLTVAWATAEEIRAFEASRRLLN